MTKFKSKSSSTSRFVKNRKVQKKDATQSMQVIQPKEIKKYKENGREAYQYTFYQYTQKRKKGQYLYQFKGEKDWSKKERKQIEDFLQTYIPEWDLNGNDFLYDWDISNQGFVELIVESEMDDGLTRKEALKKAREEGLKFYKWVLYFFAVTLPKLSPDDDHFIIFRGLHLRDKQDEFINSLTQGRLIGDYTNLGTSWSFNPDRIRDMVGGLESDIRLITKIHKKDVDWKNTLLLNTDSTFGMGDIGTESENEIRLLEHIKLPILAVEKIDWLKDEYMYRSTETIPIDPTLQFNAD
jgi:hypothetical protein